MSARAAGLGALAVAVAVAVVAALTTPWDRGSGREITAEFGSASGLVAGADVRVDGAPAGTVESLSLSRNGTASVRIRLDAATPVPRADATAAIRPVDLIGDNYVALTLGTASAPLDRPIPPSRTLDVPRIADALGAFGDSQRAGVQALLVEGGIALDERGADLNEAALALRPTLEAADSVSGELASQNTDLRSFVADAARVSAEAASRSSDLAGLVSDLDATLGATASQSPALADTLDGLPELLGRLDRTASGLASTTSAALPLARSVNAAAPQLAEATARATPFLGVAAGAAHELHPVLAHATSALVRGGPALSALGKSLGRLHAAAPALRDFLDVLEPAAPAIAKGFFVNFPDQAAEPGKQPFDPFADPRRHYWRGAAVLTCQSFGQPIEPGCLGNFLDAGKREGEADSATSVTVSGPRDSSSAGHARSRGGRTHRHRRDGGSSTSGVTQGSDGTSAEPAPRPPDSGSVRDLLDLILGP